MKIKFFRTFLIILLMYLPFMGLDCDLNESNMSGEIYGRWALVYNAGFEKDICPGEIINLLKDGNASLKCPDRDSINTQFTFSASDNILTYSNTNVRYQAISITQTDMHLMGLNVQRELFYTRNIPPPADNIISGPAFLNSSEK